MTYLSISDAGSMLAHAFGYDSAPSLSRDYADESLTPAVCRACGSTALADLEDDSQDACPACGLHERLSIHEIYPLS